MDITPHPQRGKARCSAWTLAAPPIPVSTTTPPCGARALEILRGNAIHCGHLYRNGGCGSYWGPYPASRSVSGSLQCFPDRLGPSLTLEGDANQAANLSVDNGSLIVARAASCPPTARARQQNRYYNTNVSTEDGITVRSGGKVEVPQYGYSPPPQRKGGMHLDEGGSISSAHACSDLDRNPESQVPNVFAGTVTISDTTSHQARVEVNDGLTLEPTARVFVEGTYARFDVYGGMTTSRAVVESSGRVNINGRSENPRQLQRQWRQLLLSGTPGTRPTTWVPSRWPPAPSWSPRALFW